MKKKSNISFLCIYNTLDLYKEILEDAALTKEVLHSYDKNNLKLKCQLRLELIEKDYLTTINLQLKLQLLQKID